MKYYWNNDSPSTLLFSSPGFWTKIKYGFLCFLKWARNTKALSSLWNRGKLLTWATSAGGKPSRDKALCILCLSLAAGNEERVRTGWAFLWLICEEYNGLVSGQTLPYLAWSKNRICPSENGISTRSPVLASLALGCTGCVAWVFPGQISERAASSRLETPWKLNPASVSPHIP